MTNAIEIIKGRLFWFASDEPPKNISNSYYFSIDDKLTYEGINEDFGPLDLGKTWKYVTQLEKLLSHPECRTKKIYHLTSEQPQKAANSAFLMGAFQIMSLRLTAKQAFEPFQKFHFKPFRDAGYDQCTYQCTLLDCLNGLEYAIKLGWLHYKTFNLPEYEFYEKMENGDINWVIPNKFIAFSSPSEKQFDKFGSRLNTPNDYVPIFKRLGVKTVVRLSNKTYQANDFVKKGIKHEECFLPDYTLPSMDVVNKFLEIAQAQKGALAVHCKAGLSRTGTLIACYALKHYYFPAAAFIGWIRIVRPGSIIGNHQEWLLEMQSHLRKQGIDSPIRLAINHLIGENQKISKQKKNNVSGAITYRDQNIKADDFSKKQGQHNIKKTLLAISNKMQLAKSKSTDTLKSPRTARTRQPK